ncbi:MAG: TraX family protein [Agathobacter rectalis]
MLIPLRYYNGKRGISLKYVFYAFYPVHLFVLYLICRLAMAAAVHT